MRSLAPGEVLFREQEPCAGLWLVLEGNVLLVRGDRGGRGQILRRCGPGETLNDAPAFDGGDNAATAVAEGAANAFVIGHRELRALLGTFPKIGIAALEHLAGRMRHLVELAGDLALLGVPARIAKLLLRLADPDGRVPEDVTQ